MKNIVKKISFSIVSFALLWSASPAAAADIRPCSERCIKECSSQKTHPDLTRICDVELPHGDNGSFCVCKDILKLINK
jgi:hypothetical protein